MILKPLSRKDFDIMISKSLSGINRVTPVFLSAIHCIFAQTNTKGVLLCKLMESIRKF